MWFYKAYHTHGEDWKKVWVIHLLRHNENYLLDFLNTQISAAVGHKTPDMV